MSVDQLCSAAAALVDDGVTPAVQLAVARDNDIVCFETFGNATNDTRFLVFSATKPIVASAIWTLIGDGVLDITRPVAHYVPEFATNGKQIVTVEQVLLHTAGFPNALIDPVDGADPVQRVKRFMEWQLEWEPGSRFEYHALSAHWVLAELLERLTGSDFRDVVEQRVCDPLGLPRLLGIPEEDQDDIATGAPKGDPAQDVIVHIDPERWNGPALRAAGVPGGGAIMTAATMARFYQGLLHNPKGVWDDDVLRDATSNVRNMYPDPLMNVAASRTIGLVVANDDGLHQFRYAMFGKDVSPRAIGHAGAFGQVAWADPESGISFAMLKSGWDHDMFADALRIIPLTDLASSL